MLKKLRDAGQSPLLRRNFQSLFHYYSKRWHLKLIRSCSETQKNSPLGRHKFIFKKYCDITIGCKHSPQYSDGYVFLRYKRVYEQICILYDQKRNLCLEFNPNNIALKFQYCKFFSLQTIKMQKERIIFLVGSQQHLSPISEREEDLHKNVSLTPVFLGSRISISVKRLSLTLRPQELYRLCWYNLSSLEVELDNVDCWPTLQYHCGTQQQDSLTKYSTVPQDSWTK